MRFPWNRERVELDREVAYHIETLADSFETQGMTRREALRRARREFGAIDSVKEQCGDESPWRFAVQAMQDLRFGWRMMKKSPTISVAAVLSLALGIGATTVIYSFAHAVLWRKMAVPAPQQMLEVTWALKGFPDKMLHSSSGSMFLENGLNVADFFSKSAFEAMRARLKGKVEVAAHEFPETVSTSFGGNVAISKLRAVSENFFPTLRLQAQAGRLIDGSATGPQVVVSYRFWQQILGGRDDAIGATMRINNRPYIIAGVLPRDFFGIAPGDETALYTTIHESPGYLAEDSWVKQIEEDPYAWWLQLVARRAEGVSLEEAQAALHTAFAATWPERPKTAESTPRVRLIDASTGLGDTRRNFGNPVWILMGLVSMVLLVACANIANLLLARAAEREKEVAMRISLGCGSARLMRQFLTESLLIALLGGALSAVVALALASLLGRVMPEGLDPLLLLGEMQAQWLGATAAITVVTALLFGLYPAWRASRSDAFSGLREGAGVLANIARGRFVPAKMLVLAQVSLGVMLVMAAILFTGNLSEIVHRETGFERSHALIFDVRPGELGYKDGRLTAAYSAMEERLRAIPGVTAVGISRTRPMRGGGYYDTVTNLETGKHVNSAVHHATAGFVNALGVPLVAGRGLTAEDVQNARKVAVLSERLAKEVGARIGMRIKMERDEFEVIGIAKDARYSRLTQDDPVTYLPFPKDVRAASIIVRTHVKPESVVRAATDAVHTVDGNLPLVDVNTMEEQISRTLRRERMFAWLCGSFGVLALVLCVVGLYGLMSHTTARRTPEIGIRMAVGASAGRVLRQVVSEGMVLAAAGMVLGIPLAIYGAKLASKQQILPQGPIPYWTLGAALAVLVVSAFVAVFGPAWRAASVDPMKALRQG